jgi:prepilin-type N-terminal cleavage/methylation domain-containing protein
MRVPLRLPFSARRAFTLVELIVAITIMAVLAGLAVLIVPALQDNQRVTSGTDKVQGALFIAKQWAIRDRLPRGVRLVPTLDPDGQTRVHSLQYIEQPDYFFGPSGSALLGVSNPANGNLNSLVGVFTPGVDFFGGNGPANSALWPVQIGDFLDLMGNNKPDALYKILSVNASSSNANVSDNLTLMSQLPVNLLAPSPANPVAFFQNGLPFRILRGPRVMIGQQAVNLPNEVAVDSPLVTGHPPAQFSGQTQWSLVTQDSQTKQIDILFSPSGKVLRDAGSAGKVVLWIYDNSVPDGGQQNLVVVYTRAGIVASHPAAVNSSDPWQFIRDGRSSGM